MEMQGSQLSQRSEEFKINQRQKFALIQEKRNQKKQEFLSKIFRNQTDPHQDTEATEEQRIEFDIVSNKTLILETKNSSEGISSINPPPETPKNKVANCFTS